MTTRVLITALAAVLLTTGASRAAEDDTDFGRRGFYFGLGPQWALEAMHTSAHTFTGTSGATVNAVDSFGADGRIGYRLNRFVAVEGEGQFIGDVDLKARVPGQSGSNRVGSIEAVTSTANFKLYPIEGRVQPYVLGGLGLMWAHQENSLPGARRGNDTELAGRGGLGLDVYLDRNFAVNLEGSYLAPASNLRNYPIAAVTTGVQYHF